MVLLYPIVHRRTEVTSDTVEYSRPAGCYSGELKIPGTLPNRFFGLTLRLERVIILVEYYV